MFPLRPRDVRPPLVLVNVGVYTCEARCFPRRRQAGIKWGVILFFFLLASGVFPVLCVAGSSVRAGRSRGLACAFVFVVINVPFAGGVLCVCDNVCVSACF